MKSFLQSRDAGKTRPYFLLPAAPYGTGKQANGSRFCPAREAWEGGTSCWEAPDGRRSHRAAPLVLLAQAPKSAAGLASDPGILGVV